MDANGKVVAVASSPHSLQTPKPLWSEKDPPQWWEAVAASIRQVLSGVGTGHWNSVPEACAQTVKVTGATQPDPAQIDAYRQGYSLYHELYPALKSSFEKMAL